MEEKDEFERPDRCDICKVETSWLAERRFRFLGREVPVWFCPRCEQIWLNRKAAMATFLLAVVVPLLVALSIVWNSVRWR